MTAQAKNWFDFSCPERGTHRLGIADAEIWLEQDFYDPIPAVDGGDTIKLALSVITDSIPNPDPHDPAFIDEIAAHLSTEDLMIPLGDMRGGGADGLDGVQVTVPDAGEEDLEVTDSPGFLATPILGELTGLSMSFKHIEGIRYQVQAEGVNDGGERFSLQIEAPFKGVLLLCEDDVERSTVEAYLGKVFDAPSISTTWKEPGFRWVWTLEARFPESAHTESEGVHL